MPLPNSSAGKEFAYNAGDPGLIPGLGRSLEEGIGYPFQYSGLENSMNCIVHGVAKSQTQLGNFHFLSLRHEYILSPGDNLSLTNSTTSQKGDAVSRISSKCLTLEPLSRIPFLTLCDLEHTQGKALLERAFWGQSAGKAEDSRGDALEYASVLSSCRNTEVGIIH